MVAPASACKGDLLRQAPAVQQLPSIFSSCWMKEGWNYKRRTTWASRCHDGRRSHNEHDAPLELDANLHRRLDNAIEFWTLLVATALKNVTLNRCFSIDALKSHNDSRERKNGWASWSISVARILTIRPQDAQSTHQQPYQRLSCCVRTTHRVDKAILVDDLICFGATIDKNTSQRHAFAWA